MRTYDHIATWFFIISFCRDSRTYQRIMIEHSTDELDDANPDGVVADIVIDSIPADEGKEECSTSTVAAVSLSTPDLPVTSVLHRINSEVVEDGYDSDGFLPDGKLVEEETMVE